MIGALIGTASGGFNADANLIGIGQLSAMVRQGFGLFYGLQLQVPLVNQIPGAASIGYEFYPAPFGAFPIAIGVDAPYGVDWTRWLARYRPVGSSATAGLVVRPNVANGFQYVCTQAGQSSNLTPLWPTLSGQTVIDGSVIWMCEDVDDSSLLSAVESVTWETEAGITFEFGAISSTFTPLLINTNTAQAGSDYVVTASVEFQNGVQMVATLLFQVPQALT